MAAIGVGLAVALAGTGIAVADSGRAGTATADGPIVVTGSGAVRGTVGADHRSFQGIPYAQPPVGESRWAPPRPAARWSGTRDATKRGNDCAQTAGFLGDAPSDSEDCLYLNVTTPRRLDGRKVPVMFFVHGGGFYSGSGALYRAERLAADGEVVVVTFNYRLGVFGFLAHPSLGVRAGNFGLEDQQSALRWVRSNAASFGGDPDNVTLIGESAGSVSTCAHLAAPSSAGLFRRAVMQSGPCDLTTQWPYLDGSWLPRSRDVAEDQGRTLATAVGCADPATAVACLRGASVSTLLAASAGGQGYGPVFGAGGLLPISPKQALATGRFNKVPVLHGTTRDEHRTFVGAIEQFTGHVVTADDYRGDITAFFGDDAARVLTRYPLGDFDSPSLALAAVWTDSAWACTALATDRSLGRQVPTFAYEFADEQAPWSVDGPRPSFPTGAFHASELQYLFHDEQFPGPETAAQRRLSDQMIGYWTRFAHTGDPNGAGLPGWPQFHGTAGRVQSLAPGQGGIGPVDLGGEHRCDFWQTVAR
jgi:para-nitrobenzyl esterase